VLSRLRIGLCNNNFFKWVKSGFSRNRKANEVAVCLLITQEQSCNHKKTMTKEHSENAKVEPAPPSSDNNKTIRVVFEVKLRPKDQKVADRVTLANKVVERMSETIELGNFFPPSKGDTNNNNNNNNFNLLVSYYKLKRAAASVLKKVPPQ
jgi:hypothetical protein